MKTNWALGFALLLGASMFLGYASPTWGGEMSMAGSACPTDTSWSKPEDMSGLIGSLVLDQNNQELGRVVGVRYDNQGETTSFLIVSSCLPGMNGELVAIPYTAYPLSTGVVTLGLSKEDFEKAPRYSSGEWYDWPQKAYEYWEKTPYFG